MAPLLELAHVGRSFQGEGAQMRVLDDISLGVEQGEIVCLVGESGCGKTTTGKLMAGLMRPSGGEVRFKGRDVWRLPAHEFRRYRRAVQIVHQDPYASLNPTQTVAGIIGAPLLRHRLVSGERQARERMVELLQMVELTPAEDVLDKYPHQLSGGQRQRISLARALSVEPSFIVADEAVSMLDVSIRVSLLKLLLRLREQAGITFVFITHDLAVAKYFAWHGRIAVMYLGRIVEIGPTPQVIGDPQHPYTRALISALPDPDPRATRSKKRVQLRSLDVPSLLDIPRGCAFHPRCPLSEAGFCDASTPALASLGQSAQVACHVVARERGAQ